MHGVGTKYNNVGTGSFCSFNVCTLCKHCNTYVFTCAIW